MLTMIDHTYIFELLSLAFTFPTIITGFAVLWVWGPSALKAIKSKEMSANEYFILGVVMSFFGAVVDNFYWSFYWASEWLYSEPSYLLFNGAAFNLIFRQGSGIIAAFCHLKAAELSSSPKTKYASKLLFWSNIAACSLVIILPIIKVWVN